MDKRIMYPTDQGLAVIVPCDCGLSLEDIAAKDVPPGVPYRIVDAGEFPGDRTFRAAWEADFANPDGFGLGAEAWFAQRSRPAGQPEEGTA